MKKYLIASTTLIFSVLASAGVQAATTVTSVDGPDGVGQTIIFDFEGGVPAGLSGNGAIVTGTVQGQYAAPLGDTSHYLAVPGTGSSGTALLELGASYRNLSFYWGSIDTYNSVEFFTGANGSGTSLGAFAGNQVPGAVADGNQSSVMNNRRVFFDFGGASAQSVVFTSNEIAFELDDIATAAVPEPATWATLVIGMGLTGAAARRRRNTNRVIS